MRLKLFVPFLLIVLLPLVLLGWLGTRVARNEREIVRNRFLELLSLDLDDIASDVSEFVGERERILLESTFLSDGDILSFVAKMERNSLIQQCFVLDATGHLLFPDPAGPANPSQEEFLLRTERIWRDKDIFHQTPEETTRVMFGIGRENALQAMQSKGRIPFMTSDPSQGVVVPTTSTAMHGWYTWFWDKGLHLIFWQRLRGGGTTGAELNRSRLIADLIAELPDTALAGSDRYRGRIALRDSNGSVLYQWGNYSPPEGEPPRISRSLDPPLQSWGLEYYVSGDLFESASGGRLFLNTLYGLMAVGIALLVLAIYFYRESSREIREASQRVTFVNQVSHELKTPLTNIRMYAELLESEIPDEGGKPGRYLGIIVGESQRLSRLIGNILTFSRKQRSQLAFRPKPECVDEVVSAVLHHFEPSLTAKGIRIETELNARQMVELDRDALEQILGNLFGNVEKYAATGGLLRVASRQEGDRTALQVSDEGPGIPWKERERLFAPFYRISNKLTDGVTGTGIGLSIARDLARLHGGDVTLVPSSSGACFRIVLHTPPTQTGGPS